MSKKIKSFIKFNVLFRPLKKKWWIVSLIIILFLLLFPIIFPGVRGFIIGKQNNLLIPFEKEFLTLYITLLGVFSIIVTLWYNFQRLKKQGQQLDKQQKQIDIQVANNIEVQYSTAISILGSESETARIGAIHTLKKIADKHKEFIQPVMDILCSHIRITTKDSDYKDNNKHSPSSEIQACINSIFKIDGVFYKNYINLDEPNLSNSFLNGADFTHSICIKTNFDNCYLRNAQFDHSDLIV